MLGYMDRPGWWKAESKLRHVAAVAAVVALVVPGAAAAAQTPSLVKQMHGHTTPGGVHQYRPTPGTGSAVLRD